METSLDLGHFGVDDGHAIAVVVLGIPRVF
jgi:hypothetical protein